MTENDNNNEFAPDPSPDPSPASSPASSPAAEGSCADAPGKKGALALFDGLLSRYKAYKHSDYKAVKMNFSDDFAYAPGSADAGQGKFLHCSGGFSLAPIDLGLIAAALLTAGLLLALARKLR